MYQSPISSNALGIMSTIKNFETNIQFHYAELNTCITRVAEFNEKAQEYTLKAGAHQEKLRLYEKDIRDSIQELKEELNSNLNTTASPQQDYMDIGRSE